MPVVTACLWRAAGDDCWRIGEIDYPDGVSDPDGAVSLFARLVDPSPEAFRRFAEDYYEVPVDLDAVRHFLCPAAADADDRRRAERRPFHG